MILHSGITLYHGSYVAVEKPELERCYPYKDFGRGFYLGSAERKNEARKALKMLKKGKF